MRTIIFKFFSSVYLFISVICIFSDYGVFFRDDDEPDPSDMFYADINENGRSAKGMKDMQAVE